MGDSLVPHSALILYLPTLLLSEANMEEEVGREKEKLKGFVVFFCFLSCWEFFLFN